MILTPILPFVYGLTSFSLHAMADMMDRNIYDRVSSSTLMDITRFSELENLSLKFGFRIDITDLDYFLEQLVNGCPKLRDVTFSAGKYNPLIIS